MALEEYEKARKLGLKEYRGDSVKGRYPYVQVLDEILSFTDIVAEQDIGLLYIPIDLIIGTKTKGRTNAFSRNFYPLLDEKSEFAIKWEALYQSHLQEGIREPVIAYEFMHQFYIQEGNKRVSVLKYEGADSVLANVVRLIPQKDYIEENQIYYEFLDFYRLSKNYNIYFQKSQRFSELANCFLNIFEVPWSEKNQKDFQSSYYNTVMIMKKMKKYPGTIGDAILSYIKIFGAKAWLEEDKMQMQKNMLKAWDYMVLFGKKNDTKLLETPEKSEAKIGGLFQKKHLKIAFINVKSAKTSIWTYSHMEGKKQLEKKFGDKISVITYDNIRNEEQAIHAIKNAIERGCQVIFTTTPVLLNASLKMSVEYPKIKILNCSLNIWCGHMRTYYGKFYETRFLLGLLAGILTDTDQIGYIADYPIYGMISNINAFALGVRMTNPRAKIHLVWSTVKNDTKRILNDENITYILGQDLTTPDQQCSEFGLFSKKGDEIQHIAIPIWNWNVFYEKIIKSIFDKSWDRNNFLKEGKAISYWWGLSAGAVSIAYTSCLDEETKRFIEFVKQSIADGKFQIYEDMCATDIIEMDSLYENIIGEIPSIDYLEESAKKIVELQGTKTAKKGL